MHSALYQCDEHIEWRRHLVADLSHCRGMFNHQLFIKRRFYCIVNKVLCLFYSHSAVTYLIMILIHTVLLCMNK